MTFNLKDRSNYLRGIILLNIKYNEVSSKRSSMIKEIGSILGFNKGFIEEALKELVQNKYISEEPPKFSNVLLAEAFLKDSIKIALSDNDLHLNELQWLWAIASINSLSKQWLYWELETFLDHMEKFPECSYEILKFMDKQN
jgi:hypothetical protein